jgi:hypothetical protein
MIKKIYNEGDTVWVFGINRPNTPTKGRIVKSFEIEGYLGTHYVVAIPTHIEDLLEIRTWETISQDEIGPIGMLRDIKDALGPTNKFIKKIGYDSNDVEEDEPSQEQILAAIEKSRKVATHDPLILKTNKPRRRRFSNKKKA